MALDNAVLETQQSIVQLLASMFLGPGELEIEDESQAVLSTLTEHLDSGSEESPALGNVHITIHLSVSASRTIALSTLLHLRAPTTTTSSAPLIEVSIKHPSWLSRTSYEYLLSSLPSYTGSLAPNVQGAEDGRDWLMQIVEHVDSESTKNLLLQPTTSALPPSPTQQTTPTTDPAEDVKKTYTRAWFYLPSLSTRSKRSDMVHLAQTPKYNLTGFVLAGKPGLLVLESTSSSAPLIDAFISEIKTVSWADIPPHQKKITERHRETGLGERAFEGMREITDMISTRGERGNRGDMGEVRSYLEERGLKGALEIVLGANEFR